MRKRFASVLLAVVTTIGLIGLAVPAGAAPSAPAAPAAARSIPLTGTATDRAGNHSTVTGTFTPQRAIRQGQGVALLGRLTMNTPKGTASRTVAIPVQGQTANAAATPSATAAATPAAVCQVLNLVLGPLHLNLLGLIVDLNQVVLNITADPNGGLLGSLLCSLAGGPTGGALSGLLNQLVGVLNQILAGLGG
jgi:hypothetical protein